MTASYRHVFPVLALLIVTALAGCGGDDSPASTAGAAEASAPQAAPPAPTSRSETGRLNAFLDRVYERNVAARPERETALGRKTDQQGEWNDYSDAFADGQLDLARADLETLRSEFDFESLDENGKLSYELFVYGVEQDLADAAWRRHDYVIDQFNGQISGLFSFLQNEHRIDTTGDAEDYIRRIAGLRDVFEELTRQLQDRAGFGVMTPAFAYPDMIADVGRMTGGFPVTEADYANPLFADFTTKLVTLDAGEETTAQLEQSATEALQGPFREGAAMLLAELERLQSLVDDSLGVWSLPDGDAYYQNRILHHSTLNLSAGEIHRMGLDDVARIHGRMRAIMEQVGFDGTLQDFFEFVRTDPNNFYENSDVGREQFLAEARQQIAEIEAVAGQWFNILPRAALEVRRVEPWRENSTSIAFYNQPSEDGSRPGIYYANMKDMTNFQKYVFTAITYHESVPGHHFQIANAMELEGIPKFRKYDWYGAYTEGWALYAEQLAREMGFYRDPMRDFGRLQDEIWRSVRLVTDTGIHAMRWTRAQAIEYFRENTPLSEGDIVTEVERFFVNPGQALGYKLGMMKILELRERAREQLADDFDIRAFHDVVIGRGAMPLPILERQVDGWIACVRSGACDRGSTRLR
jgi:uncharacterized protein (DUF885 family)